MVWFGWRETICVKLKSVLFMSFARVFLIVMWFNNFFLSTGLITLALVVVYIYIRRIKAWFPRSVAWLGIERAVLRGWVYAKWQKS